MRKVVASLFISLDGVVEAPNEWQFDVFDGDMMAEMVKQIDLIDSVLLGRVTYQEWSGFWPNAGEAEEPFTSFINQTPKYVVSTTLDEVAWGDLGKVELLKGDLTQAITRLKDQPGGNIGVNGSPSLVHSLLEAGLLDELYLQIHPVVAGKGKRLFKDGDALQRLSLVDSKVTSTGVIMLCYQPRKDA